MSFLAKTRPERVKPDSLAGCHKGQCIRFSIIYGSIDGFVLLRSSYAVAFAEGPTPKVPAVARIVQIVVDKKNPLKLPMSYLMMFFVLSIHMACCKQHEPGTHLSTWQVLWEWPVPVLRLL